MIGAANYENASIIVAEGRALRGGIQAVVAMGYKMLDIEGDNLIIIGALQGMAETPWPIRNVIKDIQMMLSQDVYVKIQHIYQEANMATDWFSKCGYSITSVLSITECFNTELQNIVKDDVFGRTLMRRGASSIFYQLPLSKK